MYFKKCPMHFEKQKAWFQKKAYAFHTINLKYFFEHHIPYR